jgi:hypothetical protein
MQIIRLVTHGAVIVMALVMSGCATSDLVMNRKGPIDNSETNDPAGRFNKAARTAAALDAQSNVDAMLRTGFALIDHTCSEYFTSAGRSQTWLIAAKDTIGVLSSLSTGAIALKDGSDDSVAAIAFGSNALNSGLDVYTRNYLFGADNIEAVRTLTFGALEAHRAGIRAKAPSTYDEAGVALIHNQNYCQPRKIAEMTRKAISTSDLAPYTPSGGEQAIADQGDGRVKIELGRVLGLTGPVDDIQIASLWWLTNGPTAPTLAETTKLRTNLGGISTDLGPFDDQGRQKSAWPLRDLVNTKLNTLSSGGKAALNAWVIAQRDANIAQKAADDAAVVAAAANPGRPSVGAKIAPAPAPPELGQPVARSMNVDVKINGSR